MARHKYMKSVYKKSEWRTGKEASGREMLGGFMHEIRVALIQSDARITVAPTALNRSERKPRQSVEKKEGRIPSSLLNLCRGQEDQQGRGEWGTSKKRVKGKNSIYFGSEKGWGNRFPKRPKNLTKGELATKKSARGRRTAGILDQLRSGGMAKTRAQSAERGETSRNEKKKKIFIDAI